MNGEIQRMYADQCRILKNEGLGVLLRLFIDKCRNKFSHTDYNGAFIPISQNNTTIKILFELDGGIGDKIISLNYLANLKNNYDHISISVLTESDFFNRTFIADSGIIDGCFCKPLQKEIANTFDIRIWLYRYPVILYCDYFKVGRIDSRFMSYVLDCEQFSHRYPSMKEVGDIYYGQFAQFEILRNRHRYQQPDFNGQLGLDHEYLFSIKTDDDIDLDKFGLQGQKFITIHSGVDTNLSKINIKMWPTFHYNDLIRIIKEKHPNIVIIQIGASKEREDAMQGTDMNLVGETTMEETKILLKNAALHIDCEGGLVHIRHALHGGPSAVIFGPTSIDFYGYPENINIRGNGCSKWCEFTLTDWHMKCVRGFDDPPCMTSVSADMVYEKIHDILENGA